MEHEYVVGGADIRERTGVFVSYWVMAVGQFRDQIDVSFTNTSNPVSSGMEIKSIIP